MNIGAKTTLLMLASYLIGSIPIGVLVARAKGVDILKTGSGNPGATNVGRTLGRKWGVLVLVLDMLKGASISLAAMIVLETSQAAGTYELSTTSRDLIWLGAGMCCIFGNLASIFLRFKGGKGVATSFGVILGIYPYLTLPGLVAGLIWAIVVKLSRYVSLGSIVASCSLPFSFVVFARLRSWPLGEHYPLLGLTIAIAVFVLIRHRSNLGRLIAGTENRIGPRPS